MRKLFYVFIIVLLGGILPTNAYQPYYNAYPSYCCDDEPGCFNWEFYFGGTAFNAARQVGNEAVGLERFFGSEKRSASSPFGGAIVGVAYRDPCGCYFNVEFDWAMGNLNRNHHRGFHARHVNQFITDIKLGYNFSSGCWIFTPYGGVGNWTERYETSNKEKFCYSNWYGIVGGKVDHMWSPFLAIGIDAEVFIPFSTHFRFRHFDSSFKLKNGLGGKVEVPFRFDLSYDCLDKIYCTIAPFYRGMYSNHSKMKSFRTPKFSLHDAGAKIYLGYCY